MPESITYGQLRKFLLDLEFEDKSVKDSHWAFRHENSDTVILLAIHRPTDLVGPADLKYVRRILIERGLIPAKESDRLIGEGHIPNAQAQRSTGG